MNYGFLINNRTCIGCHACSTACKSENEVPLGVYRTWVKYTESGTYPDVRRSFQVTRCNHCANPPCVRICPVTAMYQRHDGIVEFDGDECIGCKACLQACPYDAIHIDPESGTAAKCHYCSHRTDIGLEPACVVVCPEHSIVAGDLDDPQSEIRRAMASEHVTVRKPEQGTAPKLFYVDGDDAAMHPSTAAGTPSSFMWADVVSPHDGRPAQGDENGARSSADAAQPSGPEHAPADPTRGAHARQESQPIAVAHLSQAASGVPIISPGDQGVPALGAIQIAGRLSEHMVQVAYNVQHVAPWHWPVPAYLVTKAIAAGLFMVLGAGVLIDPSAANPALMVGGGLVTLLMLIATTLLLILDLERPERFIRILTRPQWKSWLTRGAFLLIGFSVMSGLWWFLEATAFWGNGDLVWLDRGRSIIFVFGLPLAAGVATYTAFLFGQAEGRDLWQSPLLPLHFLVRAVMAGAGTLLVLDVFFSLSPGLVTMTRLCFGATLIINLIATLVGEFSMPHASELAARAAHIIIRGRFKTLFWVGSIALGHGLPLVLLLSGSTVATAAAGTLAVAGLYAYEHAFVLAPQDVPNS